MLICKLPPRHLPNLLFPDRGSTRRLPFPRVYTPRPFFRRQNKESSGSGRLRESRSFAYSPRKPLLLPSFSVPLRVWGSRCIAALFLRRQKESSTFRKQRNRKFRHFYILFILNISHLCAGTLNISVRSGCEAERSVFGQKNVSNHSNVFFFLFPKGILVTVSRLRFRQIQIGTRISRICPNLPARDSAA